MEQTLAITDAEGGREERFPVPFSFRIRFISGNFQGEAQKFLGAGVTAVMVFAYIFDKPFKTLP